ncbi:peptidase domain-containing ABC transporter [uncultured Croceitalea sp.]|uniref:peptidase domain-containing ABC transporter n=1 Tax=uncultured Croceitalea sp. TaxID=1798908 RepID=UPI003305A224
MLQRDQSDCGVACLLTLVRYYDGEETLENLRIKSGTSQRGTSLLGLYQAANSIGFTAQGCESDIDTLVAHSSPVILHVIMEGIRQHYVVCYGYQNDEFIIGDPAKGILRYSKQELVEIWQSRKCLVLEPKTSFEKRTEVGKQRKKWFLNVLKPDYRLLGISVGLGIGIALLSMAMSIFSQKLIDDILPSKATEKLITGIALLGFILLVRVSLNGLRSFFLIQQTKDFNNRIIDQFYTSLLHLPKLFFDTRKIGDMVARLNDTNRIQKVIQHVASNFVIDLLIALVSLSFLYYYSWQVGIIASISLPVYFLLIYTYNTPIINAQKMVMQNYSFTESNYISSIKGIAEVKAYNRQNVFRKMNQHIYGRLQESILGLGKINMFLGIWSGLTAVIIIVAILSYTSYRVLVGQMELGKLMAILGITGTLLPSVANLALVSISINEGKVAFSRMFEFTNLKKEKSGSKTLKSFGSFEMKDVSFRYAGRKQLLKEINIRATKNQIIALIGESGSGKSTIGKILQKSYSIENGSILVNDQNKLKEIDFQSWRNLIGIVPQEISIFPGNVFDNIVLGIEEDVETITGFCKKLGLEKYFNALPQGYATLLGEEGTNLSGGQKQLIALARTLFKKPQLLILDEATSAMDIEMEQFVLNLLKRIQNKMCIVFITHRLHILRGLTDNIYVLENGTVSATGNHNQLIASDNLYARYWNNFLPENLKSR